MSLPIILLHGFPFDGGMWARQSAFLRARGQHVLTPDLPGFGATPAVPAPSANDASIEDYAEDIHQLIRHLGPHGQHGVIVGGFSMGGYVLLALLRAHPEVVAGAIFMSTRAEPDAPEARANRLKSIEDIRARGTANFVASQVTRLLRPNPPEALQVEMRTLMARQSPTAVIAAQSAMSRRRDQTDLLAQLKIPSLFVVGAQDSVSPPAVARAMHEKTVHSQYLELPQAGHMTPLEAPDELSDAIARFAASVKPVISAS